MPIFRVSHTTRGQFQTNRVRVEETDPTKAAAEITTSLADSLRVDPKEITIEGIEPEAKPEPAQAPAPKK